MQKPDVVRLTNDQQPAVSEATQHMALGDKITMEFHLTLKSRDQEGTDFNVEAVVPEGYELDKDADEAGAIALGSTNEPVMTPLAVLVRKKKKEEQQDGANSITPAVPGRTG